MGNIVAILVVLGLVSAALGLYQITYRITVLFLLSIIASLLALSSVASLAALLAR